MGAERERPVVVLTGPTASGKTGAGVSLARALDAEIVSVDSGLVYRRLDIGTAKPTLAERGGVPHHLIDVREPWEPYSAADFVAAAVRLIGEIRARGRTPLLVGGTLLYVRALERGLAPLPPADERVRADIAAEAARRGWPALHAELARVDRRAAARIHPNDRQRLQRALEVYRLTGVALGELQRRTRAPLARAPLVLALAPERREWLHERIARRLDAMVAEGFLDEVRALRSEPLVHAGLPAMRSVGYRQAFEHLDGGERSDDDWVARARAATRRLAKRQLTWLRGVETLHVVPCDTLSEAARDAALLDRLAAAGVSR